MMHLLYIQYCIWLTCCLLYFVWRSPNLCIAFYFYPVTQDPLATGVLVVGVGKKGTSQLQQYLTGTKGYRAGVTLGFQTTTLDLDPTGHVVEEKPYDHVTLEAIEQVIPQFTGTIQQIPPVFRYVHMCAFVVLTHQVV